MTHVPNVFFFFFESSIFRKFFLPSGEVSFDTSKALCCHMAPAIHRCSVLRERFGNICNGTDVNMTYVLLRISRSNLRTAFKAHYVLCGLLNTF